MCECEQFKLVLLEGQLYLHPYFRSFPNFIFISSGKSLQPHTLNATACFIHYFGKMRSRNECYCHFSSWHSFLSASEIQVAQWSGDSESRQPWVWIALLRIRTQSGAAVMDRPRKIKCDKAFRNAGRPWISGLPRRKAHGVLLFCFVLLIAYFCFTPRADINTAEIRLRSL